MNFNTVICEVILVFYTFSGISAEFDKERFSRVRYLVSNKNDLSVYQNKPVFQWDSTSLQETTKTPENQRKKRKHRPNSLPIQESIELANSTETISENIGPRKKKNRRRKKLRKNRKLKNQEITTIPTNLSLDELIKKVNDNPEGKFNNLNGNILLQNKDKSPISGQENTTKFINLTVETLNPKNKKPKRKNRKKSRCRFDNGGCSQVCRLKGPEKCACSKGYILDKDKRTCIDIDECQTSNGGCHSICDNKIGAHECKCNEGFRLGDDGKSCVDINECILNNGHGPCEDTCHNTNGSYLCECKNGTVLAPDMHTCADIDECSEGKSGCSHTCINTFGGAFCACPDGLELSADWKTCQDINECDDENIRKICNNNCINTVRSYKCNDYQNDENFRVPVCKPLSLPSKGYMKCSRLGAYKLFSSQGRPRIVNSPGTSCDLICPIGYKLNGKHHVTCSFNGQWEGSRKGLCKKAPPPSIQCPVDQYFKLKKEASSTIVRFPRPKTNMKWDLVKSHPKWAKRLIGKLNEGRHKIRFEVTDPETKLRSYCYFKVYIVKYQS